MGQIRDYVHDNYGDDPDKQIAQNSHDPLKEARRGRGSGVNWTKYTNNRPKKWKRPEEWGPNPLDKDNE